MQADVRRIVAAKSHRRRAGRCPVILHSLGTGETFEIRPTADGFVDLTSNVAVQVCGDRISFQDGRRDVDLRVADDIALDGFDHNSNERFFVRAGGGASVTIYDQYHVDYFQYAVAAAGDRF